MKKASILFAIVALGACTCGLFGQGTQKSGYPFKVGNKVATAMFAEKTYDEVWVATLKALFALDYRLAATEKDAGIIGAEKGKYSAGSMVLDNGVIVGRKSVQTMTIMIEVQGDRVAVSLKSQKNKVCSAFYDKLAELLYGKVEKK